MEYNVGKNIESQKYINQYGFKDQGFFKKISSTDGKNRDEVMKLLKSGLKLIPKTEQAKIYYLAISLLDNIDEDLSSIATDIMLYAEEVDNVIPKEFSSTEDIAKKLRTIEI
ncbi:MAG: hypothetical protein WC724_01290 [Candidatus Paceibacterota bacterium]|jgi:hypothetical protein